MSGASTWITDRSAKVDTLIVWTPLSSPDWPSDAIDEAVAVFVRRVPAGTEGATATVRLKTATLPTANEPVEQETVPPAPTTGVLHCQSVGDDTETKVVPAGSGSVHVAAGAASGPLFVTVIV